MFSSWGLVLSLFPFQQQCASPGKREPTHNKEIWNSVKGIAHHRKQMIDKKLLEMKLLKIYKKTYSWKCIIRWLRSIHMVIWVHKLLAPLMAKNLWCSVSNNLKNVQTQKFLFHNRSLQWSNGWKGYVSQIIPHNPNKTNLRSLNMRHNIFHSRTLRSGTEHGRTIVLRVH
jgi:hypothetical protein